MNLRVPKSAALAAGLLLVLTACDSPVEYEEGWLDSPSVLDPSLNDPGYRLSTRPGMTAADRDRPVVIAVHGFTASTFEWQEFREYAETGSDVLVSLVLLGAHGRDIDQFKESRWEDWGPPILEEYAALVAQGYTNISIATASTGGPLVLEQLSRGLYDGQVAPRHFFFIDPIVVPGDKTLTLIPLLKYLIGGVTTSGTAEETAHWYQNRPSVTLAELYELLGVVREELAEGMVLPAGSKAIVYKTSRDRTADPVSALLIYKGLRQADGTRIGVQMFDSDLHVFTRLRARDPLRITDADRQRQRATFEEMIEAAGG